MSHSRADVPNAFSKRTGHLWRDAGSSVQQVAEGLPVNPEYSGGIGHG
jgi:hypothetical protein